MELVSLAIKDLLRRKGKTSYLLIAVVIPVTILSTIIATLDNADRSLSDLASKFGFTMIIQPKNIKIDRIDQIGVILEEYISEESVPVITHIIEKNIHNEEKSIIVAKRLYFKADIHHSDRTMNSVLAGIDFDTEISARPSWKLITGGWPLKDNEAVIGGAYAKAKDLHYDDRIIVNNNEFRIVGVLENYNSSEDYMVFIPFQVAQKLFDKEGFISVINIQSVSLDKEKDLLNKVVAEINRNVPNIKALLPQQFSTMKYVMLKKTFKFLVSIVIATVIVSIFSIFNIVTTVLYSRVKEIGLLKSVGASRYQLLKIFLYEYLFVGFIAGIIGYPLGLFMTYLLDSLLLKIGAIVSVNPQFLFVAVLVGVLCSLTASFYPTYKLSRIKITETFKSQWEV